MIAGRADCAAEEGGLWLREGRCGRLLAAVVSPPAWMRSALKVVRDTSAKTKPADMPDEAWVIRLALRGLLSGENDQSGAASAALAAWCKSVQGALSSEDLCKAHLAVCGAVIADCGAGHWKAEEKAAFVESATALGLAFFQLSPGNPHSVTNNWWAVTHGGLYCLAEALVAVGSETPVGGRSPVELAAWAWARLEAFLGHFGPGGGYHEGLGYLSYTCSALLPAVILHRDLHGWSPPCGLSQIARLLFTAAIEGRALSDETLEPGQWGRMLSWNDAGTGWCRGPTALLAAYLAPAGEQATYKHLWERLEDVDIPDESFGALFFHLLFQGEFPADAADSPARPPLVAVDCLHGIWVARNRWADERDAVAGAYARAYHPGGHSQNDAGSIRFSAGGHDWILGGGQARAAAVWQSRLVPSDNDDKRPGCGSVMAVSSDGRAFGMDLRSAHGGYSERYVALCPDASHSRLAVLDLVNDHLEGRRWTWCLTISPGMVCELGERRCVLRASDGQSLEVAFLMDQPESMRLVESPVSRRTFVSGKAVEYPGRPALLAEFAGPQLCIFVSFALNEEPAQLARPDSLGIRFGSAEWHRPFGSLLPAKFVHRLTGQCARPDPGQNAPQTPAGE